MIDCLVHLDSYDGLRVVFFFSCFFFLMIRRPPISTLDRSSAASDVYKRQRIAPTAGEAVSAADVVLLFLSDAEAIRTVLFDPAVSYTHLRAHETVLDLVCRLLLEKKKRHMSCKQTRRSNHRTTVRMLTTSNILTE